MDHPLNDTGTLLSVTLMVGLGLGCVATLVVVGFRLFRRRELLPYTPRREVPWDFVDIVPLLAFWALTFVAAFQSAAPPSTDGISADRILLQIMLMLLALTGCYITLVAFRTQARPEDFGVHWAGWTRQFATGALGFLAVCGPVFALQWLLVTVLNNPSEHPLVTELFRRPAPGTLLLFFINVVLVAPLTEELLYRALLQGWLEKCLPRAGLNQAAAPIVVGAALFALAHFRLLDGRPQPDPIPLFPLALALGYVYQRTHRLLPVVALHGLFNLTSALLVMLQIAFAR